MEGLLGGGFVDVVGFDSHVGEDGDAFAGDLDKAVTDREDNAGAIFAGDNFARHELGHHRHVLRIDAHLTVNAGEVHHFHVSGERLGVRRDNFEFESRSHVNFFQPFVSSRQPGRPTGGKRQSCGNYSLISSMPPFM